MNRLEFSCFADFFVRITSAWVEYDFLYNPPVDGTVNSIEQESSMDLPSWSGDKDETFYVLFYYLLLRKWVERVGVGEGKDWLFNP